MIVFIITYILSLFFGTSRKFFCRITFSMDNLSQLRKELRRDAFSLKNRLQLIIYDSQFVAECASQPELTDYPIVPNERCGPWYTPKYNDTTYFKSTDGHTNEWSFSLRRLNMHILPVIGNAGGVLCIDSTRKGKLLPDALLKTIPIWCAVINSIIYDGISDEELLQELRLEPETPDAEFILKLKEDNWVRTPREMVSLNEHNQIVQRIPGFVKEVLRLELFSKDSCMKLLVHRKPLITTWWYPGCKKLQERSKDAFYFANEDDRKYNVACISASSKSISKVSNQYCSFEYVQGAGDDHELWVTKDLCGGKFTPKIFWQALHQNPEILGPSGFIRQDVGDKELLEYLNAFVDVEASTAFECNEVNGTKMSFGIVHGDIEYSTLKPYAQVVVFSTKYKVLNIPKEKSEVTIREFKIEPNKKGSKELRNVLPQVIPKIDIEKNLLILCETGDDISCGCVLSILCKFYSIEWQRTENPKVDKDIIKKHLSKLADIRRVNPSRNTLQSVNTYVM